MNRWLKYCIYLLFGVCSLLLISIVVVGFTFQTSAGRQYIHQKVQENLQANKIDLDYREISGFLPFYWTFRDVELRVEKAPALTIEKLSFQLSLWSLLYKQIYIKNVEAHHISYASEQSTTPKGQIEETLQSLHQLPLSISIQSAQLYDVHPKDSPEKTVDLEGRFYVARHSKYLFLDMKSINAQRPDTSFRLKVRADPKKGVYTQFDLISFDLRQLKPYWNIDLPMQTDLHIYAKGSWKAFTELLFTKEPSDEVIKGKVRGSFQPDLKGSSVFSQSLLEPKWTVKGNFRAYPHGRLTVPNLQVKNTYLSLQSTIKCGADFELLQAKLNLQSKDIEKLENTLPLTGILHLTAECLQQEGKLYCSINGSAHGFSVEGFAIDPVDIQIQGTWSDPIFRGKIEGSFTCIDLPWQTEGQLFWVWKQDLYFNDLKISTPTAEIQSTFSLNSDLLLEGTSEMIVSDLSSLLDPFPTTSLEGSMQGAAFWYGLDSAQALQLDLEFFDTLFQELKTKSAHLELLAEKAFSQPTGYISIELEEALYYGAQIDSALVQTSNTSENWYYALQARGNWRSPFDVQTTGFYNLHSEERLFNIQSLSGFIFSDSFDMPEPLQVTWTEDSLLIDAFTLSLSDAKLQMQANVTPEESTIIIALQHFPLDFLSLNKLHLDIAGYATMELNLHKKKQQEAQGQVDLQVEELQIWTVHDQKPLVFSGQLHGQLEKEILDFLGHVNTGEFEVMHLKGAIPLALHIYPFHAAIDQESPANIRFDYNGPVEEILDFINIGPQHLEGELNCGLELSNTFSNPKVEGILRLQDGLYENYFSGTYLHDIDLNIFANRDTLTVKSFTATDSTGDGKLQATGSMRLDAKAHFPFNIQSKFSKLECLRLDSVGAFAKGNIEVTGTTKGALAKGDFRVTRADISIPDKITRNVPDLEVSYVHHHKEEPDPIRIQDAISYSIEMELKISAPDNVFISGRGLSSKWKGDFRIGGHYPELLAKGRLDLISGEFIFSGRVFALEEGNLVFSGEKGQEPFLNISGKLTEQEFTIIASLKGNISSPELAFRSNPPLPVGSTLSYLIFGQDISELTPFQAVQLAATIASLSGEGPDILESTRRTLGVDRLAFISQPTKSDDGSEVALKVGKYITRGVLVSVAQGVGIDSTNIIVEVDLKHGFIFQAESQQQQEQGKFTLKWSHNY